MVASRSRASDSQRWLITVRGTVHSVSMGGTCIWVPPPHANPPHPHALALPQPMPDRANEHVLPRRAPGAFTLDWGTVTPYQRPVHPDSAGGGFGTVSANWVQMSKR
ncbi:hypothetical protein XELAEV_18007687mg [Xenopus laevis]|uniref:Uncharacterized protein n=1 Tax=Xenopus laevis TaxID=8355 RepID=A0A974E3C7_XENLA|nr:hypothetical protein XELAEV_18007687mg [Xenopus laevis]